MLRINDKPARKRQLPSSSDLSIPPNKRIAKSTADEQREKNELRCTLESKTPYYLQPRIPFPFPALIQSNNKKTFLNTPSISSIYPYQVSTPSTSSTESSKSYSVSSLIGDKPPQSPLMAYPFKNSAKQQPQGLTMFSPWSPLQNGLITGLPTPPSINSITNKESIACDSNGNRGTQIGTGNEQERNSVLPSFSPYTPRGISANVQSPFILYNHSPLSPMVLLGSPSGPSSVISVPSVSSSSGCSSMSDGSVLSVDKMNSNSPRIAPTEYHVGIKPSQTILLEDRCGSDGFTIPNSDDEEQTDIDVERVESYPNIRKASLFENNSYCTPLTKDSIIPSTTYKPANNYPLSHSVQSLISNKFQTHQLSVIHSSISTPLSSRDSTPEPECEEDNKEVVTGNDVFCLVPGRLSLLSATQKYKISVDEVRRRLSNPECLNASVLGGILRRAKSKNGGHHLRQRLEEKGLSLAPGRRKATEITLFTSLVEGEALHLASDHRRICQNYFPHRELAQVIGSRDANTPQAQGRLQMVKGAQMLLSEFKSMVDIASKPCNYPPNNSTNVSPGLTNFDLISHGFGNPSISTAVNVLQTYLQELTRVYEGTNQYPPQAPSYPITTTNNISSIPTTNNIPVNTPKLPTNNALQHLFIQQRGLIPPINVFKQEPSDI